MNDMMTPSRRFSPSEITSFDDKAFEACIRELGGSRADSFWMAMQLVSKEARVVETGCIRGCAGDGQSSLLFAMWALRNAGTFTSIDCNEAHMARAKWWLGEPLAATVNWINDDSLLALRMLDAAPPISLLYLDSLDYDYGHPEHCQRHQLVELGAVYGILHPRAVVLLDDADLPGGGKVALCNAFLEQAGWTCRFSGQQVVWQRQMDCNK